MTMDHHSEKLKTPMTSLTGKDPVSEISLFSTGQIRLAELSVFNWGAFNGLHSARIDPMCTLITGDNGSGKTTLVNIMGCLDNPTAGSLRVDGQEIFEQELTGCA